MIELRLSQEQLRKNLIESSFVKAEEGVYADTPANRKLNRVGMSYKMYEEQLKRSFASKAPTSMNFKHPMHGELKHIETKEENGSKFHYYKKENNEGVRFAADSKFDEMRGATKIIQDLHTKRDAKAEENQGSEESNQKQEAYQPTQEEIAAYEEKIPIPSVDDRWDAYSLFCNMVASGVTKSLVAFGTGGVGKTFTLGEELKKLGLTEYNEETHDLNHQDEFDYVKITGSASGSSVYKSLFEFQDKILIFDDCDSVLKDGNAVNFLKGALDSSGNGTISYATPTPMKTDRMDGASFTSTGITLVPNRFKFKGRVIFISNLSPKEIPQPLIDSRCLSVDLSMSAKETIDRINKILPKMDILDATGKSLNATPEEKEMAVKFLEKYKDKIRLGKLNARTLGNIIKVIHAAKGNNSNWEPAALTLLSN